MDLKTWREKNGLTQVSFAKMLSASQPAVSSWETGRHSPPLAVAARIVEMTKGEVTLADLVKKNTGV